MNIRHFFSFEENSFFFRASIKKFSLEEIRFFRTSIRNFFHVENIDNNLLCEAVLIKTLSFWQ